MNYRLFLQILLILTIISTICICTFKPQMHKSVLVYSSEFTIEPEQETEITETEVIPTIEQTQNYTPRTIKTFDTDNTTQKTVIGYSDIPTISQPVKTQKITVKNKANTVKPQTTTVKNTIQTQTQTPQIDLNKIVENNKKIQESKKSAPLVNTAPIPIQSASPKVKETKVVAAPMPNKVISQSQTPKKIQTKQITPQQEEIAWNIWRSNLQNKLMSDVALPNLPNGIVFKYSFTVDKYGKVSDVKTWSTDSRYTPYAIQYIAPVIRSYQGHAILNFPAGSNRITTVAQGAWKISDTSKYSTPQDYNDIERISK